MPAKGTTLTAAQKRKRKLAMARNRTKAMRSSTRKPARGKSRGR